MNLINMSDIFTITGLSTTTLSSLIPYAQAQANAILGFLEEENRAKDIYMWDAMDTIKLEDRPITSVSSIKYKATASATEETFETDTYRVVKEEGLLIFDTSVPQDYVITVNYNIGWNQSTVPALVKVWLCALVVNHYYSLYPDISISSQAITSKKIGAVTIKYASVDANAFKTLDQWCSYLAILIKSGGTIPNVY